ncbi:phage tail tape measure protein [Streptomyces scabiei]|uniref:phage tail tape measure protein n=1 Tax=Streptomyces scabiei TaxID=1930 RepID=UPI0007661327|nr:phage tail tape measure protein [Streptomyces scabiei]
MAILDELLVRLGVDMSEAEGEIDRGASGIEERLTGMQAAGGVAAAGLGAAFVMGLESAMDISSVTTQLQNQLSLTDEEAARAGSIAGDVFSAGFGESVGEVGEALDSVASSMHEFGSISDAEMAQLTKDALALSKTFEFDVAEAAVGAGNMIKAGLVKDGTEAMDLMTAAAQKMPKAMREEIPLVTKEYSEFFAQLGATGPQMMGALAAAAQNPLFEIDKLGDAVKEFTLRIADTAAVEAPLKELKLDVGDIQDLVNKGKGTEAFDQITKALAGVENQTDRTRIAAALMGGPGEDAQASLKAFGEAGGFAGNELKGAAGAAKQLTDSMAASPAQQFDSIMRSVTTTLGEMLLPALTFVAGLFAEHPGLVKVLVPIVLALAAALVVVTAAQWAMNAALLANPYTWIIIAIVALAAIIIANWDKIKAWTIGAWNAVWEFVKNAVDKIWQIFLNWTILGLIIKHWDDIWAATVSAWNAVVAWIRQIPGWLYNAFLNWTLLGLIIKHWSAIKTATVTKAGEMLAFVRSLPGRISSALGSLGSLLYGKGRDTVTGLWRGISSMGGWLYGQIKSFVSRNVVDAAKSFLHIGSPSKLMADEIGHWLPPGIAEGAEDNRRPLDKAMAGLVDIPALDGVNAPSTRMVRPAQQRLVVDVVGGDNAFVRFFQEIVRNEGGGSVSQMAGAKP